MKTKTELKVKSAIIGMIKVNGEDYISLTDIAKQKNKEFPADVVRNWMRSKMTVAFLGLWEQLHNPVFKLVEFDQFKNVAGTNAFVLPPQVWIERTNAINAVMINEGIPQPQRLKRLNDIAIQQMRVLNDVGGRNLLK